MLAGSHGSRYAGHEVLALAVRRRSEARRPRPSQDWSSQSCTRDPVPFRQAPGDTFRPPKQCAIEVRTRHETQVVEHHVSGETRTLEDLTSPRDYRAPGTGAWPAVAFVGEASHRSSICVPSNDALRLQAPAVRHGMWNRWHCWGVDEDVSTQHDAPAVPHSAQTFEEFFFDAWPWAFRLASLLTHSTEVGEDIVQDVLMTMSQRWGTADRPAAYLRTSLVNASYNWNRRNRTARTKLPMLLTSDRFDVQAGELADAIARLPFRQRAVVVLRYYSDLSESEIAEAIGCRPGTVKSLASRALDALSKEIER